MRHFAPPGESEIKELIERLGDLADGTLEDLETTLASRDWTFELFDAEKHDLKQDGQGHSYAEFIKTEIRFGSAVLKDKTIIECGIFVPHDIDWQNLAQFPSFVSECDLEKVYPSKYLLPSKILEASANAREIEEGVYSRLRISVKGDKSYGLFPFSQFWSCEGKFGSEVDPDDFEEVVPSMKQILKYGTNHIGDVAVVLCQGLKSFGRYK